MLIPIQIRVTERQLEQLKQLAATRDDPPSVPRTIRWIIDQTFGNLPVPSGAIPPPPAAPRAAPRIVRGPEDIDAILAERRSQDVDAALAERLRTNPRPWEPPASE